MIDIHTHIIPGVDDGARNMEMAVALIRDALRGGTKEIVLTPHCAPSYGFFNYNGAELSWAFERLCEVVYEQERMDIVLHLGMEVLYEGRTEMLHCIDDYFPLCKSRYFLIEFYFNVDVHQLLEGIATVLECGYIPIVAHPERYRCVQENMMPVIRKARDMGALFQLNKSSLSGVHGKEALCTAEGILTMNGADFIASDAHHPKYRGSSMKHVEKYIRYQYGADMADLLFWKNPKFVVENKKIPKTGEESVRETGEDR